jgi:hypothetical protein
VGTTQVHALCEWRSITHQDRRFAQVNKALCLRIEQTSEDSDSLNIDASNGLGTHPKWNWGLKAHMLLVYRTVLMPITSRTISNLKFMPN